MEKIPRSVLIVVYSGDQVLLLERREPPGYWQSVTGSLQPGERWRDAALRELGEEAGLHAEGLCDTGLVNRYPIHPAWRHRYAPEVNENEEHVFVLSLPAPLAVTVNLREHVQARWLPWADALALVSSETNRAAIVFIGAGTLPPTCRPDLG